MIRFSPQLPVRDSSFQMISTDGAIRHVSWKEPFILIRRALGIEYPGYVIHEAVQWSSVHKRWFFLPRRASNESYAEEADESRGTNVLISADENFTDFKVCCQNSMLIISGI